MMNRIELKQEAKGVVRTAAVSAYLFALLYLALTELLQGASVYVNGDVALYMQTYFPNVPIPSYLYPVALPATVVTLVAVVCWLLRVLLQGGWVLYHLGVRRGEEMPYATLFDGFGFIGKLILLNIVITLYVFLWSMLFIIPGIIAGYRYRFAVYNLCENPDIGVMEAISMSKAQTAGYKGDLFLLDLTDTGLTGKAVQDELDRHGITLNKNCVPNETRSPQQTSGVRIGTAAMTTKGYTEQDFIAVARQIDRIIRDMQDMRKE